ncbi:MAG: GNAT family N-acetyltransferase [Candidatus Binatia bacterium]
MEIRPETNADRAAVAIVHRLAFGRSEEAELVAAVRGLAAPEISLVALREGAIVGHILFTPVTIGEPPAPVAAVGLGPLAVLPRLQRSGIGSELVRQGLDAVRRRAQEVVVVLGHPGFYPRFGFEPVARHGLRYLQPVPEEAFMVLEIVPGRLRGLSGAIRYLSPFG